jgi:hypothetical protein
MSRSSTTAIALGLALALAPNAFGAPAPVEVPIPANGVDAIAYGGGRVVWATHHGAGPVQVFSAQPGGGAPQPLASVRRFHPRSPEVFVSLAVNDAGYIVSVRDGRGFAVDPSGVEAYYGEVVAVGGFDGTLRGVLRCRPPDTADNYSFPNVETAADGQRFAFGGVSCGVPAAIDTVTPAGVLTAVPHAPRVEGSQAINLALAGTTLAYMGVTGSGTSVMGVSDLASGSARRIAFSSDIGGLAAQADGTVVAEQQYPQGPAGENVLAVGPTQTTLHPVLKAQLAPSPPAILAHGGRLLLNSAGFPDVGLASLAGGPVSQLGSPGISGEHTLLAFTGDEAVFTSTTCLGAPEVTLMAAPSSGPTSAPGDGCPMTITSTRISVGPAGRTAVRVSCPLGCAGRLILYVSVPAVTRRELNNLLNNEGYEGLAIADFTLPAGSGVVRMRLDRAARRILARHGRGIATQVAMDPSDPVATAAISGTGNVLATRR